jgi:hypothetical protein
MVELISNKLQLTGWSEEDPNTMLPKSKDDIIESSVQHSATTMFKESYYIHTGEEEVVAQLRTGHIEIVSDGSYLELEKLGMAAWTIKTARDSYSLLGCHHVTGNKSDQCSHRSELSGVLGAISQMNQLCNRYDIQDGSVMATLYCDGEGTIKILQHLQYKLSPTQKHFDLINSIYSSINKSPLIWEFKHVQGHQGNHLDVQDLTDVEYLNTIVDHYAKQKFTNQLSNPRAVQSRLSCLPFRKCMILYHHNNGSLITINSQFSTTLYNLIHTDKIRTYWSKKRHIRLREYDGCDTTMI